MHPVEIQVRTPLQDLWAQISEKIADQYGPEVKYEGGPPMLKDSLTTLAEQVAQVEELLLRVEERRRYDPELEALCGVAELVTLGLLLAAIMGISIVSLSNRSWH